MMRFADAWDFVAVCGLLIFALVLSLARRRIASPIDRVKMRAAAWSLLSDVPQPDASTPHDAGERRASEQHKRL